MVLSVVRSINTMKMIESLTCQKVLDFLSIKYKNDAIESMVHCIAEIFGFQSTFFLPMTPDNRYLSYITLDSRTSTLNEVLFTLDNFKHPFSQVVYEKETREIEAQDLRVWQNQSQKFDQLIAVENLGNGLIIIPVFHKNESVQGCLVISLIDYRKGDLKIDLFNFFLKLAALHLKNIEDFRLKEDEGFYLTRSIARSERTYVDYLKKLELQESIIAHTPEMELIVSKMAQITNSNVSVLFSGSVGTGKTYLAKMLNLYSLRKEKSFIVVDCEELKDALFEEFFFSSKGVLAQSQNGTLLLENISYLPEELQVKLTSVFLNGFYFEFESDKRQEYYARIISTTKEHHLDLLKRRFLRPEFYAQISQIIFSLPDLKERKSDFKFFVDKFISQFNTQNTLNKKIIGYSDEFLRKIISFDWDGNLHELKTYLGKKINESSDGVLKARLGVYGNSPRSRRKMLIERFVQELLEDSPLILHETLINIETSILKKELELNEGKRQLVAKNLNLPLRTLAYKCQKYGL